MVENKISQEEILKSILFRISTDLNQEITLLHKEYSKLSKEINLDFETYCNLFYKKMKNEELTRIIKAVEEINLEVNLDQLDSSLESIVGCLIDIERKIK